MNRTSASRLSILSAGAPPSSRPSLALDDPEIVAALETFREALASGDQPDKKEILARFPEIRESLAACLDAIELIHQIAPQLNQQAEDAERKGREEIQPSAALGDFRIRREIGRGGMGVVYEAEQLSLGRRVALKVLPFAAVMDPRQLARFKTEAQAAAHLQHTNIVPVYAVGCDRGVHYYAMQFVEGQTLAEVIAQLRSREGAELGRREEGTRGVRSEPPTPASGQVLGDQGLGIGDRGFELYPPTAGDENPASAIPNSLSPTPDPRPPISGTADTAPIAALSTEGSTKTPAYFRAVANLGIQAAEALDHAHEQGIIHRDIKPANLMLDAKGNLWVTDFGLARIETDAGLTMTGDILGTLRYMAPEQALAKRVVLDHRCDIYSLGATLYELLALQPAFPGEDRQELLGQIATEEPRPLRRVNPSIPADLETIIRKAMAKEPEERYATAGEVAEDLKRFLENRSIRARRPGPLGRFAKWSRRNPAFVVGTLAVLLIAVVALSASTALVWREQSKTKRALTVAEQRRQEAIEGHRVADRQRDVAEQQRRRADRQFHQALAAVDEMAEVADKNLSHLSEAATARHRLLSEAVAFYEELLEGDSAGPEVADVYDRLSQAQLELEEYAEAGHSRRRAYEILKERVRQYPTDANCGRLAESGYRLAALLLHWRRFEEGREPLETARRLCEQLAAEPKYRDLRSNCDNCRALRLFHQGNVEEAEAVLRRAIESQKSLTAGHPGSADYRDTLAVLDENLAWVLRKTGDLEEAGISLARALELRRGLAEDFAGIPRFRHSLASTGRAVALLAANRGKLVAAGEALEDAITVLERLAADFSTVPVYRRDLERYSDDLKDLAMGEVPPDEDDWILKDQDARILGEGYRYTGGLPAEVSMALVNLNHQSGTLVVNADPAVAHNRIVVDRMQRTKVRVDLNGFMRAFDRTLVGSLQIHGGEGNDEIHVDLSSRFTRMVHVQAGAGRDRMVVLGWGAELQMEGGPGDDFYQVSSRGPFRGRAVVVEEEGAGDDVLRVLGTARNLITLDPSRIHVHQPSRQVDFRVHFNRHVEGIRLVGGVGDDRFRINAMVLRLFLWGREGEDVYELHTAGWRGGGEVMLMGHDRGNETMVVHAAADFDVQRTTNAIRLGAADGEAAYEIRFDDKVEHVRVERGGDEVTGGVSASQAIPAGPEPANRVSVPRQPYVEREGVVAFEAEHYTRTAAGARYRWQTLTDGFENPSGGAYVQVLPNDHRARRFNHADVGQPPLLEYDFVVRNPGAYRLYVRWEGPFVRKRRDADSFYAEILGQPNFFRFNRSYGSGIPGIGDQDFATAPWQGSAARNGAAAAPFPDASIDIDNPDPAVWDLEPGQHTLRISLRRDGTALDRLVLQKAGLPAPQGEQVLVNENTHTGD